MDLAFDLDAEVVRLIKAKVIELPTYPGVALQLQRLISTENFGIDALVKLVEVDAALATQVMRAANSAFFRAASPVTMLAQAISRVGANELSNIAIAGTLGLQASIEGPLVAMRRESWRRSLVGALLSQELARCRGVNTGEAFLAGLLHDFGETIAYSTFEVILEEHPDSRPQNAAAWQWEAQRYHIELGMALAADWKLPDFVIEAVMRHHDTDFSQCEARALVEVVALCDDVTTRLFDAPSIDASALAQVPSLQGSEREAIVRVIARIPSLLESFEPAAASKPVPSLVAQPASTLVGERSPVDFPVTLHKKDQHLTYRAIEVTASGLRVRGAVSQPERNLVNVEFEGLKLCATVALCVAADDGCVIELKPFAMAGDVKTAWARLQHEYKKAG